MRPFPCPRHFRSLVIVPFLAGMFAFPASAQTSSGSVKSGSGAASTWAQSESTVGPIGSKPEGTHPESDLGTKRTGSTVVITIDKSNQKMTVAVDGVEEYDWPVSTGQLGYSTPSGTYAPTSMNEMWYSKQWDNSPMPHSIFFMKDGHAIHGSYAVKTLGKAVSHGCVRISPENAAKLYNLVKKNGMENTQVVLTGVTPGGEAHYSQESGFDQVDPGWYPPGDNYYAQPQWRRGWRSFDGPYYNEPQGYYAPPPVYYRPRGY